ncbi:MAG TPA: hypothetical protein VN759_06890, partial [Pseudolysinimonas sp.]|nr:hypothetical protein [Pseudolysinimonas sp.]
VAGRDAAGKPVTLQVGIRVIDTKHVGSGAPLTSWWWLLVVLAVALVMGGWFVIARRRRRAEPDR